MTRGIQEERSLVRLLWKYGFAVVRSPASGGSTKMARPDILAGSAKRKLQLAIEVKSTRKKHLYISKESVDQLVEFAQRFGCQPILALKFKGRGRIWIFIQPGHLTLVSPNRYRITFEEAIQKGKAFKSFIK